jgi:hypothetical protein
LTVTVKVKVKEKRGKMAVDHPMAQSLDPIMGDLIVERGADGNNVWGRLYI